MLHKFALIRAQQRVESLLIVHKNVRRHVLLVGQTHCHLHNTPASTKCGNWAKEGQNMKSMEKKQKMTQLKHVSQPFSSSIWSSSLMAYRTTHDCTQGAIGKQGVKANSRQGNGEHILGGASPTTCECSFVIWQTLQKQPEMRHVDQGTGLGQSQRLWFHLRGSAITKTRTRGKYEEVIGTGQGKGKEKEKKVSGERATARHVRRQ